MDGCVVVRALSAKHFSQNLCKYRGIDGATLVTSLLISTCPLRTSHLHGNQEGPERDTKCIFSLHIPRTQMTPSKNRGHLGVLGMQILYIHDFVSASHMFLYYIIVKVFGSFRLDAELFLKISYNHTDTMTDMCHLPQPQKLTPQKCHGSIKLKNRPCKFWKCRSITSG